MREHPIPQDITGYRFHIIGNMTLKQFVEIGGGCVMGFIIYTTNLPTVIKWPLISVVVAIGALAAFVPFEERPIDHWITTFFRILYKPTKYYWKREPKIPESMLYTQPTGYVQTGPTVDLTSARRQRIQDYMTSVRRSQSTWIEESEETSQQIYNLIEMFESVQVKTVSVAEPSLLQKPQLGVRIRSMRDDASHSGDEPAPQTTPAEVVVYQKLVAPEPAVTPQPAIPEYQQPHRQALDVTQVAQDIVVPELKLVQASAEDSKSSETQARYDEVMPQAPGSGAYVASAPVLSQIQAQEQVQHNTALPFPTKPTEPNKVVGMVLSQNNDLLNDTIIEILTQDGQVVRAVKTNALGQFFISTPLPNGTYTIIPDKEQYAFTPAQIILTGEIVEPIEIRSQH